MLITEREKALNTRVCTHAGGERGWGTEQDVVPYWIKTTKLLSSFFGSQSPWIDSGNREALVCASIFGNWRADLLSVSI